MTEVAEQNERRLLACLRRLREIYGAGRFDEIDVLAGKQPGHLTRIFRRSRRRDPTRRGTLSTHDLLRYLEALEVEPVDFFLLAFGGGQDPLFLLAELEQGKPAEVRRLRTRLHRSRGTPLVPTLAELQRIDQLRFSDLRTAEERAVAALAALAAVAPTTAEDAHLLAEAWGVLASVERVRGDFSAAAYCLRRALEPAKAHRLLATEAGLLQRLCYLLGDQGEYPAAVTVAESATKLFVRLCDPSGVGRTLVDSAIMQHRMSQVELAIASFRSSLHYLPEKEWLSRFAAQQGLGLALVEHGELAAAEECLQKATALLAAHGLDEGRLLTGVLWLRAEIAAQKRDFAAAVEDLQKVTAILKKSGNVLDLASVSLRLARFLLESGVSEELQRVAFDMSSLLQPLTRRYKYLASSLADLLRTVHAGEATAQLLDRVYSQFNRRDAATEAPRL